MAKFGLVMCDLCVKHLFLWLFIVLEHKPYKRYFNIGNKILKKHTWYDKVHVKLTILWNKLSLYHKLIHKIQSFTQQPYFSSPKFAKHWQILPKIVSTLLIGPFFKLRKWPNWQLAHCNRDSNCNHWGPETGFQMGVWDIHFYTKHKIFVPKTIKHK